MNRIFEIGYEDDGRIMCHFTVKDRINTFNIAALLSTAIRAVVASIQEGNNLPLGEREQIEAQLLKLIYENIAEGGGGGQTIDFKKL